MTLSFSLKHAIQNFGREKWINILSIFTIASSLFIITLTFLVVYNIELFTANLPERFTMMVYLKDNLSEEDSRNIVTSLESRRDIRSVNYISKDAALKELKRTLKDASSILDGLGDNPLSPSIELKFNRDMISSSSLKNISETIKAMPGVDDVYYGEKIADAIHNLKNSLRNIGVILFFTILSGVIFVTYSTVKILFYRRKEEIEILKLLGATTSFIRIPFLIEGGVIGFFSGVLGSVGTLSLSFAVTFRLSTIIPLLKTLVFPSEMFLLLPIVGTFLGIIGATIAIGRLRF
ncbi:MAG: cell division protein FtsX [Dissulfurispiraceae bacterium]